MIEATTKDRISITTDDDETVIMSGRLWCIYHAIGSRLMVCDRDDVDEMAQVIRTEAKSWNLRRIPSHVGRRPRTLGYRIRLQRNMHQQSRGNTMSETRIIGLTNAAPIKITTSEWTVITKNQCHDGDVEATSNERCRLTVMKHQDGRVIVNGKRSDHRGDLEHGTYLESDNVTSASIVRAIHMCAASLAFSQFFTQETICALPPETV